MNLSFIGQDADQINLLLRPTMDLINTNIGCEALVIQKQSTQLRPVTIEANGEKLAEYSSGTKSVDVGGDWSMEPDIWSSDILMLPFFAPNRHYIVGHEKPGGGSVWFEVAQVIFIHEIGHALGLDHVEGTVMEAVMTVPYRTAEQGAADLAWLVFKHKLMPCKPR